MLFSLRAASLLAKQLTKNHPLTKALQIQTNKY